MQMDLSSLTSFVGRQREMDELAAALDDSLLGSGQVVLLAGEPGIGKTRLATEIANMGVARGAVDLRGKTYERSATPPYWVWRDAVRNAEGAFNPDEIQCAAVKAGSDVVRALRDLGPLLTSEVDGQQIDPADSHFRTLAAACTFFTALSEIYPLILVLEDLQWADQASLQLLEFFASRIRSKRILIIGTFIDGDTADSDPFNEMLDSLSREENFALMTIGGLAPNEARELISSLTGCPSDEPVVEAIYRATGQNPFFITEMSKSLADTNGRPGVNTPAGQPIIVPSTVRAVVNRRLRNLSSETLRLLRLAAMLDRDFNVPLIEALDRELASNGLLDAIDEATRFGLLVSVGEFTGRYKLTHDLIGMAMLDDLDSTSKREMHAHIADTLGEYYGHPTDEHAAEIAEHCVAGGSLVAPSLTAVYALAAGREALLGRAFAAAKRWFNVVLEPSVSREIDQNLVAEAHYGAGQSLAPLVSVEHKQPAWNHLVVAFELFLELKETERALDTVSHPIAFGRLTGTADVLQRAVELARSEGSARLGQLLVAYANAQIVERGDMRQVWDSLGEARAIAERDQDRSLLGQVELSSTICAYYGLDPESAIGHGQTAELLADELGSTSVISRLAFFLGNSFAVLGRHIDAFAILEKGLAFATELNEQHDVMHALRAKAQIHFSLGNWDEALGTMEELRRRVPGALTSEYEWLKASIAYERGEVSIVDALENNPRHNLAFRALRRAAITDDVSTFEGRFRGYSPRFESAPFVSGWKARREASLRVTLGDTRGSAYYYEALASSAIRIDYSTGSTDRLLGEMALLLGRDNVAAEHFEKAVEFCRSAGYRPEFVISSYHCARLLLANGQAAKRKKGRELLDEAISVAGSIEMASMIEVMTALRDSVAAVGSKLSGSNLTERQIEVVRLVGKGLSNQQIAEVLNISKNTVAHHLANVRDRVGSMSRVELAELSHDFPVPCETKPMK